MAEQDDTAPTPLRELGAGLVAGAVAVVYALSYAALLFPGDMKAMLPYGVGLSLAAAAAGALWLAWRSELPFAIAGPDGNTTAILAGMVATTAGAAASTAQVGLLLALSTWLCAALFLVLGIGRLGQAVRYIPYPVVGGFLASTGWLIAVGGLRVGADLPGDAATAALREFARDPRLATTIALGAIYLWCFRPGRHGIVMPLGLVASAVALNGVLGATGANLADWQFAMDTPARWVSPLALWDAAAHVDRAWLAAQWLDMVAVALVALVTVLLGASALELRADADISLDHELKVHGWLNLLTPLVGAYLSLVSVSRSAVVAQGGGRTRAAGVVVGLACVAAAVGGTAVLGWIPRPVLGGFLLYLGLSILRDWIVDARARMNFGDWLLIVIILATTALIGFTVAVIAGVIASCVSFALSYSRVGVVQHDLDGSVIRSCVQRTTPQRQLLAERAGDIRVLVLRGVIFFGTASSLLERVRAFVAAPAGFGRVKVLVLDFSHVAAVDSSAALTLAKIARLAQAAGARAVFSAADAPWARALPAHIQRAATLDHALDLAEEIVLAAAGGDPAQAHEPLDGWLPHALGGDTHWRVLQPLLQQRRLAAGDMLMQQGQRSDHTVYFIESGRLQVTLDGQPPGHRIAVLMAGNITGEMALYANNSRSANVSSEGAAVVWGLSVHELERMHTTAPDTAMNIHAYIARIMSARVTQANGTIAALQRGA